MLYTHTHTHIYIYIYRLYRFYGLLIGFNGIVFNAPIKKCGCFKKCVEWIELLLPLSTLGKHTVLFKI